MDVQDLLYSLGSLLIAGRVEMQGQNYWRVWEQTDNLVKAEQRKRSNPWK